MSRDERRIDTQDAMARADQRAISPRIRIASLSVIAAVDLDDELQRRRVKVGDVSPKQRNLAPKRNAEPTPAKRLEK